MSGGFKVDETIKQVAVAVGVVAATGYGKLVAVVSRKYKRNRIRQSARRGLSLLLPPPWHPSTLEGMEVLDAVLRELADMSSELIMCVHLVTKHLKFWKARAQGNRSAKLRFMVLERGPWALAQAIIHFLLALTRKKSATDELVTAASTRITERITMLSLLQSRIAAILAEIHVEVDKLGDEVQKGQGRQAVAASLLAIHEAMHTLKGAYQLPQDDYHVTSDNSSAATIKIEVEKMPEHLLTKAEWADAEIADILKLLRWNLEQVEEGLTILMMGYRRPRKVIRNWVHFTGGLLIVGAFAGWLMQHSRWGDSDDLDRWMQEGTEAIRFFLKEHVEQPALAIRDELFDTFRKRHPGAVELDDVQITAESLRRMLRDFAEHVLGEMIDEKLSEQQLMELMIVRYEKELPHPLRNFFTGDLVRSLLIQVQKLKLDIETAMLELNQILRANEINFAILAGLPALLSVFLVVYTIRWSLSQRRSAEGRGRAAQLYRRMLAADAEKRIIMIQVLIDKGEIEESQWQFGMLIYVLDRLSRVVRKSALSIGEWRSIRDDILLLANPRLATQYKLVLTARMGRIYECLIPVPKI